MDVVDDWVRRSVLVAYKRASKRGNHDRADYRPDYFLLTVTSLKCPTTESTATEISSGYTKHVIEPPVYTCSLIHLQCREASSCLVGICVIGRKSCKYSVKHA